MKFTAYFSAIATCLLASLASAQDRTVVYVQTFTYSNGTQLSLLPLINENTHVTHVNLAALHINGPGDITLNNNHPNDTYYDFLWPQVKQLQKAGIKVSVMMGGAAKGTYSAFQNALANGDYNSYYQPLVTMLKNYSLDGIDLDIEEQTKESTALTLLQDLNRDMGSNFILTMAPVASELLPPSEASGLSGINYQQLDSQAVTSSGQKLVSWYNAQFYNGWGSASSQNWYDNIVSSEGIAASRILLGVLDASSDGGSGFVKLSQLESVADQLKANYPSFGGVVGWEYFNAGSSDDLPYPYEWVTDIANTLGSASTVSNAVNTTKTTPSAPYPSQMDILQALGISFLDSVKALNITSGNLEAAQGLLGLLL